MGQSIDFENRLIRTLFEDDDIQVGLIIVSHTGHLTTVNPVAMMHFGLGGTLVAEIPHYKTIFPNFSELVKAISKCLSGKTERFSFGTVKIGEKFLSIKGSVTDIGVLVISVDITRSRLREMDMLSALLEGQEMERQRLAKEIHDGVGPLISTVKLHIEGLKMELNSATTPTKERIMALEGLVGQIAEDIRGVSHDLMPSILTELGLVRALEYLSQNANQASSAQIDFFPTNLSSNIDRHLELSLYRMTQELLNNAIKHSKAKTINIQLIEHVGSIVLQVEDDGVGFDKNELKKYMNQGIGLSNVIMRTRSLNGRYTIESHEGSGLLVSIEIPYNIMP